MGTGPKFEPFSIARESEAVGTEHGVPPSRPALRRGARHFIFFEQTAAGRERVGRDPRNVGSAHVDLEVPVLEEGRRQHLCGVTLAQRGHGVVRWERRGEEHCQ